MDDTEIAPVRWQGPDLRRDQEKRSSTDADARPSDQLAAAGARPPIEGDRRHALPETGTARPGIGVVPIGTPPQ